MSFQSPDPQILSVLVSIISDGVSGGAGGPGSHVPRHSSQQDVVTSLNSFLASHRDYPWYLGWIMCVGCGEVAVEDGLSVRMSAGLLLKNELRRLVARAKHSDGLPHQDLQAATVWLPALAELVLNVGICLGDKPLRHTASTVVSSLVGVGAALSSGVVTRMVDVLVGSYIEGGRDLGDVGLEGAMDAVVKIWEDCALVVLESEKVAREEEDQWTKLWERVLRLLEAASRLPTDEFSVHGSLQIETELKLIQTLNYALYNQSAFLDAVGVLERYITSLFSFATHPSASIRRVVCVGLNHLTELAPSKLAASNNLPNLIEYMIRATEDTQHEEVALEASEFWTVFAEAGFDGGILRPFVPKIVPLLLRNMRFEAWDEEVREAEMVEEEILAGRAVDGDEEAAAALKPHVGGNRKNAHDNEGDNESDDDDDDDDTLWNLRKSAAAGLDMISTFLGDDILPILLPEVQSCLNNREDWRVREAAILALGAVSHGCHSGLQQHIDAILAAALPGLQDPRPMLRVISCWTLTRYARQIIMRATEGDGRGLDAVLGGIIERVLQDRNRVVQVSACGSLSTLVEEEPGFVLQMEGYADRICGALACGLAGYGRRALRAVYDTVGVVVLSSSGGELSSCAQYRPMLHTLFNKLDTFADGDPEILPYLDCLGNVGTGCCASSQNDLVTLELLQTTVFKLDAIMERYFVAMDSGALDPDEATRFIEHLLDAIDGMTQGLAMGHAAQPDIIGHVFSKTALGNHIVRAAQSQIPQLAQSAFGLLGDLMESGPVIAAHILPYLSPLVEAALATIHPENITPVTIDACNNAAWSLGLVAKACSGQDVAQFALIALERLAPILTAPMATVPRSLVQNAAVCLGRLALATPETLAPHAHVYLAGWCAALRGLTDGEEKADAFKGLLRLVRANPTVIGTHFKSLCECFASWKNDRGTYQELHGDMQQVVTLGVQNGFQVNNLHPSVRGKLGI